MHLFHLVDNHVSSVSKKFFLLLGFIVKPYFYRVIIFSPDILEEEISSNNKREEIESLNLLSRY